MQFSGQSSRPGAGSNGITLDHLLVNLKRRLVRQASLAIGMLEQALEALWAHDAESCQQVRQRDEVIDLEEVAIERDCHELLALHKPVAKDFRVIAFILKVNADIERVADHACSIAKVGMKLADRPPEVWPTALRDLGERLPPMCHELLRAVLDEDAERARALVVADKTIDKLDKRLFEEATELIARDPTRAATGLLIYRLGRELERIGDLMANIAEDVVYLETAEIIRHAKNRRPAGM